jgi:hypothetical protein
VGTPVVAVLFHINEAIPEFDAGRLDNNAVRRDVPRRDGAEAALIARQHIQQVVQAIRDVSVNSSDRSVSAVLSRTTHPLLSCICTEICFLGELLYIPSFCYCYVRRKKSKILSVFST